MFANISVNKFAFILQFLHYSAKSYHIMLLLRLLFLLPFILHFHVLEMKQKIFSNFLLLLQFDFYKCWFQGELLLSTAYQTSLASSLKVDLLTYKKC